MRRYRKPRFRVGYSSFPEWSTLGEIRRLERERGNYFPRVSLDPSLPAKWVARSRRIAYSYHVLAKDSYRVRHGKLTRKEVEDMMYYTCRIPISDKDIVIATDDCGGHLIVRLAR
jgi:predicted type IV restriction endonuclease